MDNLRIIDADGHVQERDANWQELLEAPYRKHAPKMIAGPDGKEQLLLEGKIWAKPSGAGLGIGTAPYSRRPQKTTGMFDPIQRIKDLENLAMAYTGVEKAYAIQAGRELRVIVEAEKVTDADSDRLSFEIAQKIQNEMTFPGQIKVTVIREKRAVNVAR